MTTQVFEEAESTIKSRMLDRVPEDWDKEEGSFIHDAVAPVPLEIKVLQQNQDFIVQKVAFGLTAEGDYLDNHVAEQGLTRNPATYAKRVLTINANAGTSIPKGTTVSTVVLDNQPVEFTTDADLAAFPGTVVCTCKTAGTVGNVPDNVDWVIIPGIVGVISIENLGNAGDVNAVDKETDESLRSRWLQKVRSPGGSGSKADYVNWALSVTGVGSAKCIPLWNGAGTVKVIIGNSDKQPASAELVAAVQAYIDPNANGDGSGVAPIGATTTVVSVTSLAVTVSATVVLETNAVLADVKAAFEAALVDYFKGLVTAADNTVRYTKVGNILGDTTGIKDYSNLLVNAGTANIVLTDTQVPTKGTVTLIV